MLLPDGVQLVPLAMHADDRGIFTELFRQSWFTELTPLQWNAVHSKANVLRGVHVHLRHADYVTVVSGHAVFGLCDLRRGSPTYGLRATFDIAETNLTAVMIPPGVAHGFYFIEPSVHVYAVSQYWDVEDELGCHFADPTLALDWPTSTPHLSQRDAELPPLSQVMERLHAWTAGAPPTPRPAVASSGDVTAAAT
jgi:dTDP-4-dehydrorhamnose 3,5-epimerase